MALYFPTIDTDERSRDFQEEFAGYNHNIKISETEFYDMKNMTGDYYPILSTRKKRGLIKQLNNVGGMINKGGLCYVENGRLYLKDVEIEEFSKCETIADPLYEKVIVPMGAYLIIFNKKEVLQDGWYVNTENTNDYGYIDNQKQINSFSINLCDCEGSSYGNISYIGNDEPSSVKNGYLWVDTTNDEYILKKWSSIHNMWVTISDTYVKIQAEGIAEGFSANDAVYLDASSLESIEAEKIDNATKIVRDQMLKICNNQSIVITAVDESIHKSWIMVPGFALFAPGQGFHVSFSSEQTKDNVPVLTIEQKVPYLDYVCESNNRLWGCRYGLNRDGETVNEIYACKQGDFRNWFCYAGISTDSYAVSVGADGCWTGCIPYGSYVLFFKEDSVHQIYGTMPSNYQLIENKIRGVEKGSDKSLCNVNDVLFYKSPTDFCYYDGTSPVSVSSALGEIEYRETSCVALKSKIYINMVDKNGEWNMFVYDISTGLWHKEDNIQIKNMCRVGSDIYYIDKADRLGTLTGKGTIEENFDWYAETGNIGYAYSDNKYIGRLLLRVQKPLTSKMKVLIAYDDNNVWETVACLEGQGVRSYSMPIMPKRCDHFRLRIEGKGECKVFSLSKTIEVGSDI